jgi:hypothetical protein
VPPVSCPSASGPYPARGSPEYNAPLAPASSANRCHLLW